MNKRKQSNVNIDKIVFFVILAMIIISIVSKNDKTNDYNSKEQKIPITTLNIISSSENEDLEPIIKQYALNKGYTINFEYAGSLEIMQKLNKGETYDAVWLSNSIWMYMLDSKVTTTSNSKCTSINPVIFAVTKSKAEELGLSNEIVYTQGLVNAISNGSLNFCMSNPTSTNSGASAYLGLLSTLAGNPEVLKSENLNDEELKNSLKNLFGALERSSGSEDFLEEMFLNGDYNAVVTYESSIISINKKLEAEGKETLYAIYPVDGVSISDSPFAYIDNGIEEKKEIFLDLQSYILSNDGQKALQEKGRRTWYGGVSNNVDSSIFNPNWGINTTQYISPIKYPNTSVIKEALNLYQNELRKPVHVVFCLDYSKSMDGEGYTELMSAMDYILSESAANDFIQFSSRDKIDIVAFGSKVLGTWHTDNGLETSELLDNIHNLQPIGTTALYSAAERALEILENEDSNEYNLSVVLMTDGQPNVGTFSGLSQTYSNIGNNIPIYSIMFGDATMSELLNIANMSKAKVFDGKSDLVKAFKEVRGYN